MDLDGEHLMRMDIVRGPTDPVAPDGYRFDIAWSPALAVSDIVTRQTCGLVVSLFKERHFRHGKFLGAIKVSNGPVERGVAEAAHRLLVECGLVQA